MTQAADRLARANNPVVTRWLARKLWNSNHRATLASAVRFQRRSYERAALLVRAYYALSAYLTLGQLYGWPAYQHLRGAEPLWPAHWWFQHVSVATGVNIIFSVYLAASVAVLVVPGLRVARIAYAFSLLQYMSLVNTTDKVNHNLHVWLFVSVILILLPQGRWRDNRTTAKRQYFLTVVWVALLVVLLFYSLTGSWKIVTATRALSHGRISGFNVSGFSYIVANRILQTNEQTVLGHFFVHNRYPGWFLFVGTMYLETCSIVVAFRPRIHRLWGAGLILFHVGTQLAMNFTFGENVILLSLFLVCSPFAPARATIWETVSDLPVVHLVTRRVAAARRMRARGEAHAHIGWGHDCRQLSKREAHRDERRRPTASGCKIARCTYRARCHNVLWIVQQGEPITRRQRRRRASGCRRRDAHTRRELCRGLRW